MNHEATNQRSLYATEGIHLLFKDILDQHMANSVYRVDLLSQLIPCSLSTKWKLPSLSFGVGICQLRTLVHTCSNPHSSSSNPPPVQASQLHHTAVHQPNYNGSDYEDDAEEANPRKRRKRTTRLSTANTVKPNPSKVQAHHKLKVIWWTGTGTTG